MNCFHLFRCCATRSKILFGLIALIAPAVPSPALALSAGCAGLNFTTSRPPAANVTFIDNFETGERVTVQVTAPAGAAAYTYQFGIDANVLNFSIPAAGGTSTKSFVIGKTGALGAIESAGLANPAPLTVTFSCGAVPAPSQPPSTSSLLLDQTRKRFSQLAAQTTITNTSESVVDALNDAFSGNSTIHMQEGRIATSFAAIENVQERTQSDAARSAYAALARRPIPAQHIAQSPWHVWIDARYTSYDDDDNPAFGSRHLNVTGGGSYRFGSLVAGIVLGYENFDYELGLRSAKLDGHGWSGGGYFGWRFLDRLRLDGMLTYGRISYGAQADAVTADFDADRITTMLRLSGRWNPGAWYVEPSARLIYAWENQDSFTDTAGVSQPDYSFNVGVASVGGKGGIPLIWTGGTLTPIVGLFGDYRFGDDTISTVATLPNIDNGWSARLTGGLRWTFLNGLSASIDGDYGGLGQDVRFWRLRASLGAKF